MFVFFVPYHHMAHSDSRLHSICLFALTLFSEVPHDFIYYYKYVIVIYASALSLRI